MKYCITIVALILLAPCRANCNPIDTWHSESATISNRVSAAQQLVATGMTTDQTETILGKPTQRIRHSNAIQVGRPADEDYDINWWHDYTFPDGTVSLKFLQDRKAPRFTAHLVSMGIKVRTANNTLQFTPSRGTWAADGEEQSSPRATGRRN